jgi:glycyl-tRNA synthetase beta chain
VSRIEAVRTFRALPEAESLAAANKRVRNILRKAEFESGEPDVKRCTEAAEKELVVALAEITGDVRSRAAAGDYTGSLRALAKVRGQVDRFFDEVLVNVEDPATRTNRLRLLAKLEGALNQVADISKLAQ